MLVAIRLRLPRGLLTLGLLAASVPCAAEEPARDLTPIPPTARAVLNSNSNQAVYGYSPIRAYDNGGAQVLSADGKSLLMSANGLKLWNLREGQSGQPRAFDTGSLNMYNIAIALSADGKRAAVVSVNYGGGDMAVRFFNTATGKQVRELDNDEQVCDLAIAPDNQLLAIATRQRIELWNAEDGTEVRVFSVSSPAMYRQLAFSLDGRMLAAIGNEPNTVHIWETASGKERRVIHLGPQTTPNAGGGRVPQAMPFMFPGNGANNNGIRVLAFSADGRLLAVSKSPDSAIHLWDLHNDRELPPLTGFRGQVTAMVFSADGKELIAMDSEGTRLSWRMARLRRNTNVRLAPLDEDDFAELWDDLAESDSFRVYRARRHLVADPKRAAPLLSGHLKPVLAGNTARIQQLVKDLSSPNPGTRRKAMTELRTKHGEAALGALMQKNGGNNAGMPGMPMGMAMPGMPGGNATMLLLQKLQAKYNTPERQRDVIAVGILEDLGTPEARQTLEKLSKGAPGVGLTTASKAALDRLAAVKKQPPQATAEQLWTDLGSDDAAKAFRAMSTLSATPQEAAALLRKQLKPVPAVEDKEIAALLDNLSSDDFKVREQATEALSKIGEQALPAMKKALGGDVALEARKRLERLVEQTASKASAPLLRGLRAIEVLEHSGTAESKHVLVALAGGAPQAQLTREAKASLERLTRR